MRQEQFIISSNSSIKDKVKEQAIILPESLEAIENFCFAGMPFLRRVTIPETVKSIGNYCFCWCPLLEEVFIKNPNVKLGNRCFDKAANGGKTAQLFVGRFVIEQPGENLARSLATDLFF